MSFSLHLEFKLCNDKSSEFFFLRLVNMSSVTNRNVAWTQMAWENYFLSTMFLICFLSLLIALKQREVDVKCSLIVICFLLKGHLCHNRNICIFYFASLWTQKSSPSSLSTVRASSSLLKHFCSSTDPVYSHKKRKKTECEQGFSASVCALSAPHVTSDLWEGGGILASIILHKSNQMFPLHLSQNKEEANELLQVSGLENKRINHVYNWSCNAHRHLPPVPKSPRVWLSYYWILVKDVTRKPRQGDVGGLMMLLNWAVTRKPQPLQSYLPHNLQKLESTPVKMFSFT